MLRSSGAIRSLAVVTTTVGLVAAGSLTAVSASALTPGQLSSQTSTASICSAASSIGSSAELISVLCDATTGRIRGEGAVLVSTLNIPAATTLSASPDGDYGDNDGHGHHGDHNDDDDSDDGDDNGTPTPPPGGGTGIIAPALQCLAELFPVDDIPASQQTLAQRIEAGLTKMLTLDSCITALQRIRAASMGTNMPRLYASDFRRVLRFIESAPPGFWSGLLGAVRGGTTPAPLP